MKRSSKQCTPSAGLDRRQVLAAGAAASVAPLVLTRPGRALGREDRAPAVLLIENHGGLDGLNALVPYGNDLYYKQRPKLSIAKDSVAPIDDELGFSKEMGALRSAWDAGHMGIVEGVGHPGQSLSHFKALEWWHRATADGVPSSEGWVGRLRRMAWPDDARLETVTHVGPFPPHSLDCADFPRLAFQRSRSFKKLGARAPAMEAGLEPSAGSQGSVLERLRRVSDLTDEVSGRVRAIDQAYKPQVTYPETEFAASLRTIAALMDAGFGARVYSVSHGTFDAHSSGFASTGRMLSQFAEGMAAFLADLKGRSVLSELAILAYSEFGRRVAENASGGTDHGAAGPVFLFGGAAVPGLLGSRPRLDDLDQHDNLKPKVDFRGLFADTLAARFQVDAEAVLGAAFPGPGIWRPI